MTSRCLPPSVAANSPRLQAEQAGIIVDDSLAPLGQRSRRNDERVGKFLLQLER